MAFIPTKHVDGDVAVVRNASMGGKLSVAGNATFGHNVTVKGWLEAVNIKATNKGVFQTLELLNKAYPNPQDGWFAGVGTSAPFTAYIGQGGVWTATGGTIDVSLDTSQYTEDVAQLQDDIANVKTGVEENASGITELRGAVTAEETARKEADAALQELAGGVVGRMDVGAIGAVPASVADALAMAKDMTHSRWTLTYRDVLNVGVVDVFSDNMGHQLTEVLTTHYSMKDGVLDFTQHDDGAVQVYWRSYNINSPYLKNEKGTWTDWAEHVAATVRTELDDLDEAAAAAQKTADAALEASATAQTDTAALKDAVGKAGGIAMLDGDMKIPVANLPEKAVGVLEFQGTVQGVSALDMSTAQYAGVAFDTVARCFYAYTVSGSGLTGTRIYYKSWDGWQHYQNGTPYSGKIYMDTTTDTPYRWNGTTMKALVPKTVALTQEEYDDMAAAGTLDDDTYYNILEE